jgi:hypothetical protein
VKFANYIKNCLLLCRESSFVHNLTHLIKRVRLFNSIQPFNLISSLNKIYESCKKLSVLNYGNVIHSFLNKSLKAISLLLLKQTRTWPTIRDSQEMSMHVEPKTTHVSSE